MRSGCRSIHASISLRCQTRPIDNSAAGAGKSSSESISWYTRWRLTPSRSAISKELLRGMGETEEQVALPGLGLPAAIAIRREDKSVYYVRSDKARWSELRSGRQEREQHVSASQARLDEYDTALDRLRPIMENDPNITVAEAVRKLAQEKTAA